MCRFMVGLDSLTTATAGTSSVGWLSSISILERALLTTVVGDSPGPNVGTRDNQAVREK